MAFEELVAQAFEKIAEALEISLQTDIVQSGQILDLTNKMEALEQAGCICPEGGIALTVAGISLIISVISIIMLYLHKR